jgi:hypothetical protein
MYQVSSDVVDCVMVSDSYWPALQVDAVRHHSDISTLLASYSTEFATTKKPMKLEIVPQLGGFVFVHCACCCNVRVGRPSEPGS